MPEIEFEINQQTGELAVDIHGVIGPACDDIEKIIAEATGEPRTVEKKRSYYQRVQRVGEVRGR